MPYFRVNVHTGSNVEYNVEAGDPVDAENLARLAAIERTTGAKALGEIYRVNETRAITVEVARMPDNGELFRTEKVESRLGDL